MKKAILFSAVLTIGMIACKDKEKDNVTPKPELSTRQKAMIGKDWKIKSFLVKDDDLTFTLGECMMDNVIRFTDSENGYTDEGSEKCDSTDPVRETFKWRLYNSENNIEMSFPDGKDSFEVVSVGASELVIKQEEGRFVMKNN